MDTIKAPAIVLQDKTSGLYYKSQDDWTQRIEEATTFNHLRSAILFALEGRMLNLEAVMSFGSAEYDVRLPVSGKS